MRLELIQCSSSGVRAGPLHGFSVVRRVRSTNASNASFETIVDSESFTWRVFDQLFELQTNHPGHLGRLNYAS